MLTEMLLCPLMYYGSARTDDIDLDQFVIMFRALFIEGMFRPRNTMKDFLKMLEKHYTKLGGSIQTNSSVSKIVLKKDRAVEAILEDGGKIEFDFAISTIGLTETLELFAPPGNFGNLAGDEKQRLGFVESIFTADRNSTLGVHKNSTIVFYNNGPKFNYQIPKNLVDYRSGVICFPHNFKNLELADILQVRTTHLSNYENWRKISESAENYTQQKKQMAEKSLQRISQILGSNLNFSRCEDSFTPLTIERYTSKKMGAIYGSPVKIKDGRIGPSNVFLAGTDQGFLGIVGSMLSGVSIVNQHILSKI